MNSPREIQSTKILSLVQIFRNDEPDGFSVIYSLDEKGTRSAFFPVTSVRLLNTRITVPLVPESAQKVLIRVAESALNLLKTEFHPDPIPPGRCYDILRQIKNGRKSVRIFESTDIVLRSVAAQTKIALQA